MKKFTNSIIPKHMKIVSILCLICVIIISGCAGKEQNTTNNTTSTESTTEIQEKTPAIVSTSEPEINITYSSTTARIEEYIYGTSKNVTNGSEIWILVHPHTVNKYYPINKVDVQNEKWELLVGIGSENDSDVTFDIIAVLADQKAQDEFNAYFEECKQNGIWPGMNSIPDSAKEYDRIVVMREPITSTVPTANTSNITETKKVISSGMPSGGSSKTDSETSTVTLDPEIKINYTSETAHIMENITGTTKYIPEGYEVWIMVHPHTVAKYYPQNKVDILNETWLLPVGIGTENDTGTKFDIIALLADEDAQNEIKTYLNTSENTSYWPGMDKIPDSAKVYDNITVTRI